MVRAGWQCAVVSFVMAVAVTGARAERVPDCAPLEAAFVKTPTSIPAMLELGACNEGVGRIASAARWYRRAQVTAMEAQDAESERRAKDHTLAIAAKVPSVTLDVTAGARVEIDGFVLQPFEYQRYELDAGDHVLVATAPGKRTVHLTLHATEGEHQTVKVAVTDDAPAFIDRGRDRKRAGIVLGAAGLVVFGASVAYGFYERAQYNDVDTTNAERNRIVSRVRYIGTGTSLLGLAAITAGIVMYVTAPGKERVSEGTAFTPMLGDGQLGFAAAGRF